jgi:hypothetical protein
MIRWRSDVYSGWLYDFRELIEVEIEKEKLFPTKVEKKEKTLRKNLNFPSLVPHAVFKP